MGVGGVPPPGVPSPSGLPTGPPPDASAVSGPGPAPTPGVAPEEPLPPGWEMRYDNYGRRYYVDHNNRYDLNIPIPIISFQKKYLLKEYLLGN